MNNKKLNKLKKLENIKSKITKLALICTMAIWGICIFSENLMDTKRHKIFTHYTYSNSEMKVMAEETSGMNIEIKQDSLEYQKATLEIEQLEMKYDKNELLIQECLEDIESTKEYIKKSTKADEYKKQLKAYEKQYDELILQKEIYTFYKDNKDWLINEKQRMIEYDIIKKYCQLPVYKKQIDYYKSLLGLGIDQLKAEEKKLEIGYGTKLDVSLASLKKEEAAAKVNESIYQYDYLKEEISQKINIDSSNLNAIELEDKEITNTQEEFKNMYYEKNSTKSFLQVQLEAYQNYREKLPNEIEADKLHIKEIYNKIQMLELEIKQYEEKIQTHIKDLMYQYESYNAQILVKQKEKMVMEQQLAQQQLLYKKGRSVKSQITEIDCKIKEIVYENTVLEANKNLIIYTLNSCLE